MAHRITSRGEVGSLVQQMVGYVLRGSRSKYREVPEIEDAADYEDVQEKHIDT